MNKEKFEKEFQDKYRIEYKDGSISLYAPDYKYEPVYSCHENGVTGYERGREILIIDFGSLEKNMTALALKYGKSFEKVRELMRKVNSSLTEARKNGELEKAVSQLGVETFLQNYLRNNDDIVVEPIENGIVKIFLDKGESRGFIATEKNGSKAYYTSLYELIVSKQFAEQFLQGNEIEVSEEDFINLVSFCSKGLPSKIEKKNTLTF